MATTQALPDGWRPGTPSSDGLLLAAARAMADRAAAWAQAAGGRVAREDGLVLADAGSANLFVNQAMSTRPVDLALGRRLLDFYSDGQPFLLMTPRDSADLGQLGVQLMGHPPFMLRVPAPGPDAAGEVRVAEVTDSAGLAIWAEVVAAGFELPLAPVPVSLLGGPHRFWLGYRGDDVAAASAAYLGHGVVDVEAVATLPEHRGHGIGEAVTWAATRADPARPAVLIASDPGRGIYERMGYRSICRWTLWYRA